MLRDDHVPGELMRRHLPRLLLTGALLSPVTLYALGLGEIRLTSALNQPFDAEIELISPTAEELTSLRVQLASSDLFSRYGIDRPAYLSSFNFSVSRTRDGRAMVRVTSARSVTEPFVTLLVEASWARGRLLREYTVLLDPPVFVPGQPQAEAPVATPQSGAQTEGRIERQRALQPEAQTPVPTPEPGHPEEPVAREEPSAPVTEGAPVLGGSYTVQRSNTLYQIASSANPGPRRTVNQTMIALFRANPTAFDGNINRLRAGSVLRVPDLTEIQAISTTDASAEVARHAAEWSGAMPPAQAAEDASRLRLVTPEETPVAPTAAAPTTEAQPKTERPSATAAQTQTPTPDDKRLEIANPNLAGVQRNVDGAPVQPEAQATEAPAAATEQSAATAEAPPVAEEPAPQAAPERPRPTPIAQEAPAPSLGERIRQFWWVPVVLGLLVVVGLVLAFLRRRREESSGALEALEPAFEPRAERAMSSRVAAAKSRDRADAFLVESPAAADVIAHDDYVEPSPVTARRSEAPKPRAVEPMIEPLPVAAAVAATAAVAAAPNLSDDTLSSETSVRLDQQDALAEADFHMAYGLYDQAADLVKIAIGREPGRRDLKLKLLEIYFVWGNKDLFLDTARELYATRSEAAPGEWDKVLIMGKQIAASEPMFQGEASTAHVDLVDVNLEGGENRVDVDLFAEPQADQPAGLDLEFASGERPAPVSGASDSDLDFLLDEPRRGADDEPTREIDPLARTQETPTIESPMLDRSSTTLRERTDKALFAASRTGTDQTAELSIDDLGLDVETLDNAGSLEDTTSLEKDAEETAVGDTRFSRPLRDDEMTQLAPSLSSFDRTLQAPRPEPEKFDVESTGTIYIDQVDLGGGDTVEQRRPDVDSTASMKVPEDLEREIDLDLDNLSGSDLASHDTVRSTRHGDAEVDRFSNDVFTERTSEVPRIDLDVGEPLGLEDHEPTNKQLATELELSELEPVTMSEVGTKLDLARAYMDMGDPDGARSILEEVLAEGNPHQKQEAQRLLESVR
jgi:pilus assembly protein FimV